MHALDITSYSLIHLHQELGCYVAWQLKKFLNNDHASIRNRIQIMFPFFSHAQNEKHLLYYTQIHLLYHHLMILNKFLKQKMRFLVRNITIDLKMVIEKTSVGVKTAEEKTLMMQTS